MILIRYGHARGQQRQPRRTAGARSSPPRPPTLFDPTNPSVSVAVPVYPLTDNGYRAGVHHLNCLGYSSSSVAIELNYSDLRMR
ncbi:hypothetical protein DTO166G4_7440 [Paecilomyces variotii]|nr:hypothetical protein DTO166G4_7440 [Paecilomyces variotii]KAJ9242346.1 hypothetical protein DTO166G5_749 [Paecilomyces variotii]KAJ9247229.1 hypothetical protein DTO195F2_9192 [Paecilomyces variotii]KAJ9365740.1 hypothetical protein DTO280E4_36 [Paecilomyces variotii]KAJ9366755.1 hypothetical protein DTO282E5_8545 [Paecilomyces variotii]